MTVTLSAAQVIERCTITLVCASAASLPQYVDIVVDGRAYRSFWTAGTLYSFTYALALERGPHVIYGYATDSVGGVCSVPFTYVMAYELTEYGIDVYSGDAKLDVLDVVLHDELLPALPTLNFSCATLLSGTVQAVIRERGLRQYQFTIGTVGLSNGLYTYTCKASESYALTTAIMALQTAYGATSDAIRLIVPSLNIINAQLLAQTTYPQLFNNITPIDVIKQLMIQALAQASARNGNLYVFPLDVSAQMPDYHMQRLDPLTGWQKDADVYDAVVAHYTVKQFPTPSTVLTLNDHLNWTGTVSDVTQVADTLLPVPSGALGMLKSVGNCSRAVSTLFKYFDRIQFNWLPVTAAYVDISLQQDVNNKLDLRHTFAGQSGSGFVQHGSPGVSTDTVTEDISCDDTGSGGTATKFVTTVTGTTTANCSYRVTLLDAASAVIWQDVWSYTIGSDNTFSAHVPTTVSRVYQATTVRIEFTNLYLIGTDYGVQCITCDITVQTWINIDSHQQIVSNVQYGVTMERDGGDYGNRTAQTIICPIPILTEDQTYVATVISAWMGTATMGISGYTYTNLGGFITASGGNLTWYVAFEADDQTAIYGYGYSFVTVNVVISETVQDWLWSPSTFVWSNAFNLFESVDLPLSGFTRTGNPMNLATIALTFTGDNYVDTLYLSADNPTPTTVQAGTGSRAYVVPDDFGSEAGAQAYADGLLPIVSVAREQYTRDAPLSTDLGVGDTIDGDGTNYTIYAVDYRQDSKTLAAGKSMDTLMTRLAEQSRRLGTLERKV